MKKIMIALIACAMGVAAQAGREQEAAEIRG